MRLLIDVCKQFNGILDKKQKRQVLKLIFIMLIGGLMETFSVTIILPFMQVVLNPEQIMDRQVVQQVCSFLHITSGRVFLVLLAVIIAFMYILKSCYLLFEYNTQYRFVFSTRFAFQKQLLHTIMHRPYKYFLSASSGDIFRIIGGDVLAAFDVLINLLNMFTELIVAIILAFTILIISPVISASIAGIIFILLLIIYRFVRPRQIESGKRAQWADTGKNKWLLQSIEGIKEIKTTEKEDFFESRFCYYGEIENDATRKGHILTALPRLFIEGVSMATMFIVVALLLYFGGDFEIIVPTLTVVAMAAIRILPAANRIAFTMSNISFYKARLDTFVGTLENIGFEPENEEDSDTNVSSLISELKDDINVKDIVFSYSPESKKVLDGASLTIHKGESIGVVGSSGAGKTTLVDIILSLLKPQSGEILVDGVDIRSDRKGWLDQVGYIPQMIFMLDGSIKENIIFGEEEDQDSEERVWNALREASLDEFVRSLPDGLDTGIGERGIRLSGGQRQRIGIARALYRNPQVLIFDEATSALDNETENSIMEAIHSLHGQKTMIIIAHRLTTIESCDHVYRVENGSICLER